MTTIAFRDAEGDDDVFVSAAHPLPTTATLSGTLATAEAALVPKGYFRGTSITTSSSLATIIGTAIPAGSTAVLLQAETQNIKWRDDAGAASSTNGMILADGQMFFYNGSLANLRFIQAASGAILHISFYG